MTVEMLKRNPLKQGLIIAVVLFLTEIFQPSATNAEGLATSSVFPLAETTEAQSLPFGEALFTTRESSAPLKGMICTSQMPDCNPSVENIPAAFGAIVTENGPDHGGFLFGLDGAPDPNVFFHWQSFNRLNHAKGSYLVLTESQENGEGVLAVVDMAGVTVEADGKWSDADRTPPSNLNTNNSIVSVVEVGTEYGDFLNHPGGAQVMGNYVIYGNACHDNEACSGTPSRVEIWNLADPLNPVRVGAVTDSVVGGSTLAAITKLQDGSYLLMSGSGKPAKLQFFTGASLDGKWNEIGIWSKKDHDIPWPSDFEFQSIQFLTDAGTGDLYLLGTVGHMPVNPFDDEDLAYLYKLSIQGNEIDVEYVSQKHFYCSDGGQTTKYCNFNAGAGIYVTEDGKLALYAVEHDNDGPNGSIKMEQYWITCPDGNPPPDGQEGRCREGEPPHAELEFKVPRDGQAVPLGETLIVQVSAPNDAASVDLQFTPGDGHANVAMSKNPSSGLWEYAWTPISEGTYILRAIAYDSSNVLLGDETINVPTETSTTFIWIEVPDVVFLAEELEVVVSAPGGTNVSLTANGVSLSFLRKSGADWTFTWKPTAVGAYRLEAVVAYANQPTETMIKDVEVMSPPNMQITPINEYAFLGEVTGLKPGRFSDDMRYPTRVSSTQFACGVVGYRAYGGDIGEVVIVNGFYGIPDIIDVRLLSINDQWVLESWFHTMHADGLIMPSYDEDRPETWDIKILCVSKGVAKIVPLKNQGDNLHLDTGVPFAEYACAIAGFWAKTGDVNENGTHDIFQMYLDRKNANWFLRADFVTHKDRDENWDVNLLCIERAHAALDGPAPGTEFFLETYDALGDNLGEGNEFSTGIPTTDYVCGVAGFAALDGDIDEHDKGKTTNLFSAYLYPNDGTWHVRADFRTHKNDESWNIDIICGLRDGRNPPPWNASKEELRDEDCKDISSSILTFSGTCQVLFDEAINLSGRVKVLGGGFEGEPILTDGECGSEDAIGMYVNDRDPGTGKPRWSTPDQCLHDGDIFPMEANNTYDFRGVSIVGGRTIPFMLRSLTAPPTLNRAYAKLFPVPYGPGVALEWEPTIHPDAAFYEIQFSEDGGANWQIYTRSREISYGGWMNHHSTFNCGFGFERCLKARQEYSYRVRVLDINHDPLTDWSNTRTTTSFDWPAHVNLAPPAPPGPYPFSEDVTLEVEDTFGQGLQLEWRIIPYSGATYTILSGCQPGTVSNLRARTCVLRIRSNSLTIESYGSSKLASLAPVTSVDVILVGVDSFGLIDSDRVSLVFEQNPCPKGCGAR